MFRCGIRCQGDTTIYISQDCIYLKWNYKIGQLHFRIVVDGLYQTNEHLLDEILIARPIDDDMLLYNKMMAYVKLYET